MTSLLLIWVACLTAGQPNTTNTPLGEDERPKKLDAFTLVGRESFPLLDEVKGNGWSLTCAEIEDDCEWGAVFKVGAKERFRFGGGRAKELVRYLLWPSKEAARFLCVYINGGGSGGGYYLDVVDLKKAFKRVLSSEGKFAFTQGVGDINGDGFPEFIGRTEAFYDSAYIPWDICCAAAPCPPVIMTYDPATARFRSGAFLFPKFTAEGCTVLEAECGKKLRTPLPAITLSDRNNPGYGVDLLYLVLELLYSGREKEAWAALEKYSEPPVAKVLKQGIQQELSEDDTYQDMVRFQKEKKKP